MFCLETIIAWNELASKKGVGVYEAKRRLGITSGMVIGLRPSSAVANEEPAKKDNAEQKKAG